MQRSCGNDDGAGNAFECGAGMTVKPENALSTTVSREECCTCDSGYVYDAANDVCKLLTCADTDGAGQAFVCGEGAEQNNATLNAAFSWDTCCQCASGFVLLQGLESGSACVAQTCGACEKATTPRQSPRGSHSLMAPSAEAEANRPDNGA